MEAARLGVQSELHLQPPPVDHGHIPNPLSQHRHPNTILKDKNRICVCSVGKQELNQSL